LEAVSEFSVNSYFVHFPTLSYREHEESSEPPSSMMSTATMLPVGLSYWSVHMQCQHLR